ncbi:hypothetical protein D3C87_1386720 [compost metagenome]
MASRGALTTTVALPTTGERATTAPAAQASTEARYLSSTRKTRSRGVASSGFATPATTKVAAAGSTVPPRRSASS